MNYKDMISNIKKDNIKSLYFFSGEEEYLMYKIIEMLKEKYIEESLETLNYIVIDGKEVDFDSILNACETLPFMSPKKIVIIKDISEIVENNPKDFSDTMASYIENLGDYLCLIIMDRSNNFKKANKIYKIVKKLDGVVEFPRLKGRDLYAWVEKRFKKFNKEISNANINYFIQQSTYSDYNSEKTLYDLENEITKLVNFTLNNVITKEDIDLVLARTLDTNIFNLLNSITKRQ